MHILVTGGSGFLGEVLVRKLLLAGHQVRSFGRNPQPRLKALGAQCLQGTLADKQAVFQATKGVDAVFHLASKAGIWGDWQSYYTTNVLGTAFILAACKNQGVQHCIYTSSPSVVFSGKALVNADEIAPYPQRFLCHYAHTKALAEQAVLQANKAGVFHTMALRPHLIWGCGDNHLIPKLIERARAKKLPIVGDGKNKVTLTHVENAAQAHILALEASLKGIGLGEAFFIGDSVPVNLWQWIQNLLAALSLPSIEKRIPLKQAYAFGFMCESAYTIKDCVFPPKKETPPPMTRFAALQLGLDHYFNHKKAEQLLHYHPQLDPNWLPSLVKALEQKP